MVRVKELLSWFDAQRRGLLVVREIRSALKKAKLVTVPDFEVALEKVEIVSSDTHLFEAVKTIAQKEVVLVRNNENKIAGLVTTSDISLQFGSLSEPFLLLSEIENHVRRLIDGKFSLEDLRANRDPNDANRKIENVANLTFGEYIRLLDKPANWARLGYDLSRTECTKQLREVGRIRNDVMHFHPDGISPEDMELLRDTRKFLQML